MHTANRNLTLNVVRKAKLLRLPAVFQTSQLCAPCRDPDGSFETKHEILNDYQYDGFARLVLRFLLWHVSCFPRNKHVEAKCYVDRNVQ